MYQKRQIHIQIRIWSKNLNQPIIQVGIIKKHLNLQTYQQLCSMTSIYLGKMCLHFLELRFS